jgi:hypothetical protein
VGRIWFAAVMTILAGGFNAVAQLLFMSANPAWALIAITFDLLVIWAVIVHGSEMKESEGASY